MSIEISIIIPVYNAVDTIIDCLNSLADQTFNAEFYEVICINDGSTDKTTELLNNYNRIINYKVVNQINNGPAHARNEGARLAVGNLVLFTDSDCILDCKWIVEMSKPFDDKNIVGVQGCYKTKQKKLISKFEQLEIENSYRKMSKIEFIDSIGTYSAAYRKHIFMKYEGFSTQYKTASGEDFELSYRISNDNHKMVMNKKAICFHKHSESLLDYLKTKFKRGYWRAFLYKNVKNKIFSDSYTSNIMKSQFILVLFFFISIPTLLIDSIYVIVPLILILLFIILCLPFIFFVGVKNLKIALISPTIIFLRAIYFLTGMILGVFYIFKKKLD